MDSLTIKLNLAYKKGLKCEKCGCPLVIRKFIVSLGKDVDIMSGGTLKSPVKPRTAILRKKNLFSHSKDYGDYFLLCSVCRRRMDFSLPLDSEVEKITVKWCSKYKLEDRKAFLECPISQEREKNNCNGCDFLTKKRIEV